MDNNNRTNQIEELKALRAELLAEYEKEAVQETNSKEEAILLRQSLLEDYANSSDNSQVNTYEDDESDGENPKVKMLTRGRSL